MGEDQKVHGQVYNGTGWRMKFKDFNLEYGKWVTPPTDVMPRTEGAFWAEGRFMSPTGTAGWVTWVLEGRVDVVTITITFSSPYSGRPSVQITSNPPNALLCEYTSDGNEDLHANFTVAARTAVNP